MMKLYDEENIKNIASEIRNGNETNTTYKVSEMGDGIKQLVDSLKTYIPTGSGSEIQNALNLKNKNMTIHGATYQQTTTGKNLFNESSTTHQLVYDDGHFADNTNWNMSDYVEVSSNTSYTLSRNDNNTEQNFIITEFDSDKKIIKRNSQGILTASTPYTITTSGTTKYVILNYMNNLNLQFEKGATKTRYEIYTGSSASPSPTYPQPIQTTKNIKITHTNNTNTESKNITLNGEYLDEDYIDCLNGNGYENWGKVVLNGSETWVISTLGFIIPEKVSYTYFVNRDLNTFDGYCDYFIIEKTSTTWTIINKCGWNTKGVFWVRDDHKLATTVDEWKDWLSKNNVTIYYKLTNPKSVIEQPINFKNYEGYNKYTIEETKNLNVQPIIEVESYINWKK